MRIGIDIDNVISNFNDELLKEFLKHNKELGYDDEINSDMYITRGMFKWPKEEVENFYNEIIEKIVRNLKVIPGAKEYIDKLKKDGHSIYIITGRDNGDYKKPRQLTEEWLKKNEIYYDELILTDAYRNDKSGKSMKCLENNIDIMIDDSANICKDCVENNITTLLMDTPYNRNVNDIERVYDWKEIYKFINDYKKDKTKLSTTAKVLILNGVFSKIISIFSDIFLAAYFYKITEQNILYLSIYNIIGWIFATIGALFVANIIKTKDKVKLYRFGIFVKSIYIFMIMILGEKIVNYVYLIGIMHGISTATTGFPYNMIESESISNKERSRYLGFSSAIKEIIGFIVPILLGAYITLKSYQVAAILIFMFSILELIICFKIKNVNVRKEKVNLKEFYNIFKKDSNLKKLYLIEFFKGFNVYGVMSLVVSLLIIYQTNNELELGGWTSLFSLATIISMYLFGKYYNKDKKRNLCICSLIAMIISFVAVLYKINFTTVILYNVIYYIFMNIILKITEINLFDYSNKEPFKTKFNTEYFVFREIFLNIGRILGYTALLLIGLKQNVINLNMIFMLIIISIISVILISLKLKIEKD